MCHGRLFTAAVFGFISGFRVRDRASVGKLKAKDCYS